MLCLLIPKHHWCDESLAAVPQLDEAGNASCPWEVFCFNTEDKMVLLAKYKVGPYCSPCKSSFPATCAMPHAGGGGTGTGGEALKIRPKAGTCSVVQ